MWTINIEKWYQNKTIKSFINTSFEKNVALKKYNNNLYKIFL